MSRFIYQREAAANVQAQTVDNFLSQAQESNVNINLLNLMLLKVNLDVNTNPEFFTLLEYVSRALGIVETIKHIPYDLKMYRLRLPSDLCARYSINIRNLWERINGVPKDELKDAVLE